MLLKPFRLLLGLFCGYLVVNWLPVKILFSTGDYLGEFILNPLGFLAGAIALLFGMYVLGGLFLDGAIAIFKTLKGQKAVFSDIILDIGSLLCF
jgi:hypothetical protein